MAKTKTLDTPNCQKYGVPVYGAAWVPPNVVSDQNQKEEEEVSMNQSQKLIDAQSYMVFAGGGGEGRSGIPNALLLAHFDFDSNSLSDQPVVKLVTGAELPYRMAVHPAAEGLICSLPKSCRWYEWDEVNNEGVHKLGVKLSDKVLTPLEDVGQQLALAFNNEGSVLAVGGEFFAVICASELCRDVHP